MFSIYSIYGLAVQSTKPLPAPKYTTQNPPDILVHWQSDCINEISLNSTTREELYTSVHIDEQTQLPSLIISKLSHNDSSWFYVLHYVDGTSFLIDSTLQEIWVNWPDNLSYDDTLAYFLGPILGFILRAKGRLCFHGSCVRVGDGAVAFLGASGSGKSTLAAGFAKAGYRILADDITALHSQHDKYVVHPGYSRLRLWQNSVDQMFTDKLYSLWSENWGKYYVDLSELSSFQLEPVRLGYLVVLDNRNQSGSAIISQLDPRDKIISLISNTYANRTLSADLRRNEFLQVTDIIEQIPVLQLSLPDNLDSIAQSIEFIVEYLGRMQ